jgi:hypothetical protein
MNPLAETVNNILEQNFSRDDKSISFSCPWSLALPDCGSNQPHISLEVITLTITPLTWFIFNYLFEFVTV